MISFFQAASSNNSQTTSFSLLEIPNDASVLFIIAGQSNADGRGGNSVVPTEDKRDYPNLQKWNNSNAFEDYNEFSGTYHSILFPIAKYCETNNITAFAVKIAQGGTCIDLHQEGQQLYTQLKGNIEAAVSNLQTQGKVVYPIMIWIQGECDSNTNENTSLYDAAQRNWLSTHKGNSYGNFMCIMGEIFIRNSDLPENDVIINQTKYDLESENLIDGVFSVQEWHRDGSNNIIIDSRHQTSDDLHRGYVGLQEDWEKIKNIINSKKISNSIE